jgi:hypothetical protein
MLLYFWHMANFRPLLLVLFLIALAHFAQAQRIVRGTVIDELSREPVPFASIIEKGSTRGTMANAEGIFIIQLETRPVDIVISAIGYSSKTIQQPADAIEVLLERETYQLPVSTITAEKAYIIEGDRNTNLRDFTFLNDHLLMLCKRFYPENRTVLIASTLNGTPLDSIDVPDDLNNFFTDCSYTVHVYGDERSWQVWYDTDSLQLIYPNTTSNLFHITSNCETSIGEEYYLKYQTCRGIRRTYFIADSLEQKPILELEDSAAMAYLRNKITMQWMLKQRKTNPLFQFPVDILRQRIDFYRCNIPLEWEDEKVISVIDLPMISRNLEVLIPDLGENKIYFYTKAAGVFDSVEVRFHQQPDWNKTWMIDPMDYSIYTTYLSSGLMRISQLDDKNNFSVNSSISLHGFSHPKGTKVRNGKVYFLNKKNGTEGLFRLLVMPLNEGL